MIDSYLCHTVVIPLLHSTSASVILGGCLPPGAREKRRTVVYQAMCAVVSILGPVPLIYKTYSFYTITKVQSPDYVILLLYLIFCYYI